MFAFAARSACGASHIRNDDRIFAADDVLTGAEEPTTLAWRDGQTDARTIMCCVFDGVGGSVHGDQAALAAALSLKASSYCAREVHEVSLHDRLKACAAAVCAGQEDLAQAERSFTVGAGVELVYKEGAAYASIFHMGDCRVYRYHCPQFDLLTRDHSFANRYRDELGEDAVVPPRMAHVVVRYAGGEFDDPFEISEPLEVCDGDIFLAASDGLWEHVDMNLVEGFLSLADPAYPASLGNALENIVRVAQENGSPDDVSGCLISWTRENN